MTIKNGKVDELQLKYMGGASYVHFKPVFSHDSQFVFIASENRLYSYTTKTGKRYIEYKGLKEKIVNYGIYLQDEAEFLTACTIKGNILFWKISNGIKIAQTTIGKPEKVKFFEIFEHAPGEYKAFTCWVDEKQLCCGVVNLSKTKHLEILKMPKFSYHANCKIAIGGKDGCKFVTFLQPKKLSVVRLQQLNDIKKIKIGGRRFTSVAAHPEEIAIITGDSTGRVVLWQNIFTKPIQAVFHWHTLPVNTVCFSSSGTTFYSGGNECVLVKWNLEDANRKQFLPRLLSHIKHLSISPENMYLAVATADNSVHIVNMQLNTVSVIQELVFGEDLSAGLHLDPRTRALVLNGVYGHLQFYSPYNMELLYNLDVVGMNRITGEREGIMQNTNVDLMALSKNGSWMATVESRTDDSISDEWRLKMWQYNYTKQSFQLNTNVEYPHAGKVVDLKFQPSTKELNLRLVTLGDDGFFKLWQLVDATSVYKKGFAWRCASSGFYREAVPTCAAFSHDASLLAVAFYNVLTTWSPDTVAIKCSLLHPVYRKKIRHIAFGANTHCHLVVCATQRNLCVWNLLTLSMIWTVPLEISHLISDPMSLHMGVITKHNKLYIFEPSCSTPIYAQDDLIASGRNVIAAIFVPVRYVKHNSKNWYNKTQLFIIDSNKELYCLNSDSTDYDAFEPLQFMSDDAQAGKQPSAFELMTPASKSVGSEARNASVVHHFARKRQPGKLDDLLNGPIHTMVPVRMIAHSVISSMIYTDNTTNDNDTNQLIATNGDGTAHKPHASHTVDELAEDLEKIMREDVTWISA